MTAAAAADHAPPGGVASLDKTLHRYLLTRTGHITVAVQDLGSGARVLHRAGQHQRQHEASIVKVEILMTLLAHHHAPLQPGVADQARRMIENSDNDDAQALFERIGDGPGLMAFGTRAGLTNTVLSGSGPPYAWGLTRTTPGDQLRLLNLMVHRNTILTDRDRAYVRYLMKHVESDQRWGVTAGTSARAVVALKNGWLDLAYRDWQINSIGHVSAAHRNYLVAVMSTDDPSMTYGVDTVQEVSRIVWRHLRVAG